MDYTQEVWKIVPGTKWLYEASSHGRIRRTLTMRILKQEPGRDDSKRVPLSVSGWKRNRLVHRIVAAAFFGRSGLTVNHKNFDQADNRIENLEYMTVGDNVRDAIYKDRFGPSKLLVQQVVEIRRRAKDGESNCKLAEGFGVTRDTINNIVQRNTWTEIPDEIC